MNILWAPPSHLLIVFFLKRNPAWLKYYFGITAGICVIILLFWWALPQQLHYSLIPLVIALATRALVNLKVRTIRLYARS